MSLQVWLPLNGNLNNQGLSEVTVTNNGATVDSNGKIGSCYSFDGSDDFISLTSSSLYSIIKGGSLPFSIAMWVYRADTTRAILFGDYTLPGSIDFNLEFTTSNKARFYWRADPDLVFDSAVVETLKWSHLALTYDGLSIKCYINGALAQSSAITLSSKNKTSGSYYLGRDARTGTTAFNGKMNDFRLYDHCLSAKEVKEISKGLICHYKLDNNGFGNPNLITTMSSGGRTTLNGKYGLDADFSQNADTYGYFNVSPALELNSTYTLSFDVSNFPVGSIWNFKLWNNDNYFIEDITKDGHYTYTFVPSESKLSGDYSLTKFLFDDGARTNPAGMVYFTNFKIEKGSVATHWCPHTSDSMYTSLGLNSTVEVDCSGLGNNGAIKNQSSISIEGCSPRYDVSTVFNGTPFIIGQNLDGAKSTDALSLCAWINPSQLSGYIVASYESGGAGLHLSSGSIYFQIYSSGYTAVSGGSVSTDTWYHVVGTYDNSKLRIYVNGELKGEVAKTGNITYNSGTPWAIATNPNGTGDDGDHYYGKLSDVRIYATALSASDIRELYNTSASIDKNGNMYAYEFKEE